MLQALAVRRQSSIHQAPKINSVAASAAAAAAAAPAVAAAAAAARKSRAHVILLLRCLQALQQLLLDPF